MQLYTDDRPMSSAISHEGQVRAFYRTLEQAWGPQHWWPAHTCFEVIAGAYLTQNTAWANVERALANLRRERILCVAGIRRVALPALEQLIRPAGYFRQKAARLKTFVAFLDERYRGSLKRMFAAPTSQLREELLRLNGVGPETADSILLYAGNHPVFVVDAYTRRIIERHGILPATTDYEHIRQLFERALDDLKPASYASRTSDQPNSSERERRNGRRGRNRLERINSACHVSNTDDAVSLRMLLQADSQPPRFAACNSSQVQVFNEMHALIVSIGKRHCFKKAPDCEGCPLRRYLPE
jgi:endonuclease III related protein